MTVNVALIGYAFMGRAHSNAYRQVTPFFAPRLTPRLKVICGRDGRKVRDAARSLGWDEAATDWEEVVTRPDIHIAVDHRGAVGINCRAAGVGRALRAAGQPYGAGVLGRCRAPGGPFPA